jgi:hypothetical protein
MRTKRKLRKSRYSKKIKKKNLKNKKSIIKKKYRKTKKKTKKYSIRGGSGSCDNELLDWRKNKEGYTFSTLLHTGFGDNKLYLWSTSMPELNNPNKEILRQIFDFYINCLNIKTIISLEYCYKPSTTKLPNINCEGDSELEVIKRISDDVVFKEIDIPDMDVGGLKQWKEILTNETGGWIEFDKPEEATLIHCLAGMGRTGSILLFIALREYLKLHSDEIVEMLTKPYFKFETMEEYIEWLKGLMISFLEIDESAENENVKQKIKRFKINYLTDELFNTDKQPTKLLLAKRLNIIKIFLKLYFVQNYILLYNINAIDSFLDGIETDNIKNHVLDKLYSGPLPVANQSVDIIEQAKNLRRKQLKKHCEDNNIICIQNETQYYKYLNDTNFYFKITTIDQNPIELSIDLQSLDKYNGILYDYGIIF